MYKLLLLLYFLALTSFTLEAGSGANVKMLSRFPSKYVSPRDIYIRIPKNYAPTKKYPVLYMQDGQMLFSHIKTWNGQSWGMDETITSLVNSGKIEDVILVGISSIPEERHSNYFPEKVFLSLDSSSQKELYRKERGESKLFGIPVNSDDYLKFLVYELKPFIDQNYSTLPDREHTFIAGSSMGGLISMYAFFEYPEIYGGAACLSTHWIGGFEDDASIAYAFENYIRNRKYLLFGRKLYFDHGTETLDQYYGKYQRSIDSIFADPQYRFDYLSLVFPGDAHEETAWQSRISIPLEFLLGN